MNLSLTLVQIEHIKTMLADAGDGDDERLLIDMIEGETDALSLVRKLLDGIEADEGVHAALTQQMADRKARRDRCETRIEQRREAIAAILTCAGVDKLPLPEATVSVRTLAAKLAVNDPAAVPDAFTKSVPKPDMDKIRAGYKPGDPLPNWLRTEPERVSLTVRRR